MAGFLCVATIRSSVAFFGMFFLLTVTFFILAIGYYKGEDVAFIKAGGYLGLITALLAWYNGMAGLWNTGNSYITLPLGQFPWAVKGRPHIGRPPRK
jgi:succinate-acetate transporter protein